MKLPLKMKLKLLAMFRFMDWREKRQMRKALRAKGFMIYTRKAPAIRKAHGLTNEFRIVYWVIKEEIGYYVVNLEHIKRLNKNEMKRKGGERIHTKDLDKICEWRSPFYNKL